MRFKPPIAVAYAALKGLELRHFYDRGGTEIGIKRAKELIKRKPLTVKTLKQMNSFFSRHQKNKDTLPSHGNGQIAWLLWGGDAGRRWAKRKLKSLA